MWHQADRPMGLQLELSFLCYPTHEIDFNASL